MSVCLSLEKDFVVARLSQATVLPFQILYPLYVCLRGLEAPSGSAASQVCQLGLN